MPTARTSSYGTQVDPRQLQAMDAPLIALTQQCNGDLRQLMYAFFSFLNRRTDFYLVPHPEDVQQGKSQSSHTMGFKEGDAEKMLLAAFRQLPLRRIPKGGVPAGGQGPPPPKATTKPKATKATTKGKEAASSTSPSAKTTTKTNTKKEPSPSKSSEVEKTKGEKETTQTAESSNKEKTELSKEEKTTKDSTTNGDDNDVNDDGGEENKKQVAVVAPNMKGIQNDEEGLQIPVGNGGSTPRYKWTQTIDEITVLIGIPKTFRGKDYDVSITASKLTVKAKKCLPGEEGDTPLRTFVEGALVAKIRVDESTWSVEGGVMIVTLEKKDKKFWRTVYVEDLEKYKIDTELVDTRRRIDEYDDATQAQFRKTIFDQTQYHLDAPYSDEILGKTNKTGIPGLPSGVEYRNNNNDNKTDIPELPPGVEYIDKKTLDDAATKGK